MPSEDELKLGLSMSLIHTVYKVMTLVNLWEDMEGLSLRSFQASGGDAPQEDALGFK